MLDEIYYITFGISPENQGLSQFTIIPYSAECVAFDVPKE